MARVSGLFVDPEGEQPLTDLYAELTGEPADYAEVLRVKKQRVLRDVLGSDLNRLTALLVERLRAPPPPPRLHAPRAARRRCAS